MNIAWWHRFSAPTGAHADLIVLDSDPLEDIRLLADPAAHMALVIQAGAVVRQL